MTPKNTICLWYDSDALDAANFYAETFPDSQVNAVHRAPGDYPGQGEGHRDPGQGGHGPLPQSSRGELEVGAGPGEGVLDGPDRLGQEDGGIALQVLPIQRDIVDHIERRLGTKQGFGKSGKLRVQVADFAALRDAINVDHLGVGARIEICGRV